MKILVLQLARLGDIYLSWPGIRALKRQYPHARITLLTREKFVGAAKGLESIDEVLALTTREILEPLVQDSMDVKEAHGRLGQFVKDLRARGFDRVLNLSFSPVSSYLAHLLRPDNQGVAGYSRTADGFLAIPDDMSAYFYAQVGPGRPNRFHLAEIFGTICGVDLEDQDWRAPVLPEAPAIDGAYIAAHVGASEGQKRISVEKWVSIFSHFRNLSALKIVLIGADADREIAERIVSSLPSDRVENWVGKTTLHETMALLKKSVALIGGDSAPMHMASLTQTRCLNLSVGRVNFWETGPRAAGSWVIRVAQEADLASDRVARVLAALTEKLRPELGVIQAQKGTPSYVGLFPKEAEFQWKLVQAIYQGTPFPEPVAAEFWQAYDQLFDINKFLIEQLGALQNGAALEEHAAFIDRGEEVIGAIGKLVPSWGPVIRWYQTEKIRIGPDSAQTVLARTLEIQNLLQQLLELYGQMRDVSAGQESEAR